MLKRLFTSGTRIKLLGFFLFHPDDEYFIRELTRKLDEQINSVRRELDNLKKVGLLKSKNKNRKKYYVVDKSFIAFHELKSVFVKAMSDKDEVVRKIAKCGEVDLMLLSGIFVEKISTVDLLIVSDKMDKQKLETVLNAEIETEKPVKYSILTREDFLYRLKCKDRFIRDLLIDKTNMIAIDNLNIAEKDL
ncbi:MAG: hypothetical protein AAB551_01350 [Patescibacteria group bacterium]